MNKFLILSIVLLNYCTIQSMQKKPNLGSYVEKARASAQKPGSSEWVKQLESLQDKQLLSEKTLELGVPESKQAVAPKYSSRFWNYWLGNYKHLGKKYYLSRDFDKIFVDSENNAFDYSHYEIYFMPDDNQLYTAFDRIVHLVKHYFEHIHNERAQMDSVPQKKPTRPIDIAKKYITFIAIRPTPGITKSPYDGQNMPRIIVSVDNLGWVKDVVENLIYFLSETTKDIGCIGVPRYSLRFADSCVFWRFGSPDNPAQLGLKKPEGSGTLFTQHPFLSKEKSPQSWQPNAELVKKTKEANKMRW